MSRDAEINYLQAIGPHAALHAIGKPFSDPNCGAILADFGTFVSLLPPAPLRLLDLGCGTGWTSIFLARMGYEVVGVDIASDMIAAARDNQVRNGVGNLAFEVADFENLTFDAAFDCVTIYQSLHHSGDERAVLAGVHRALRPAGTCITAEPGTGHAASEIARGAVAAYGITERDMPPSLILAAARAAGFRSGRVFPVVPDVRRGRLRSLKWAIWAYVREHDRGYVVLRK